MEWNTNWNKTEEKKQDHKQTIIIKFKYSIIKIGNMCYLRTHDIIVITI